MSKLVSRCLEFMNYTAIFVGFTSLRIDYSSQKIYESRLINCYVVIANIITVFLLPIAHALSIKYITVNFKNNLLAFTDLVNLFIVYTVVVFSVLSRFRRERIYKEISRDIFKLDRSYFNKLTTNARIEKHANVVIFIKMITVCLEQFVPITGILYQAIRVDIYVWMLALYTSLIESILHAVLFLFFYMLWQVQKRVWRLNAHLKELLHSLQKLHKSAAGMLPPDSSTLQQLSALAEEELSEITGVQARLIAMLLRLNSVYRWQVIVVLLTYLSCNIAYGYYWVVSFNSQISRPQNVPSIIASLGASVIVFIDINLLYWGADAITSACQDTGQILRRFQELPLMSAAFERQCEHFALQLKQQQMNINIAGMFSLNRQTSLALWAFSVRHIVILVQFDYEARKQSNRANGVLDHINHMLQFGDDYLEL
ncbi:putative gustatory receptor 22c [Zeugodacus cucurbitae]|uniref:putative gustatory receptor 22c n=1 Tax=Zeugodacus cucurbitae TaxID=28588 RepID=UPI0023D96254|nr:putative gustatory receptor 22c [Zeugodacus cucurbitae]